MMRYDAYIQTFRRPSFPAHVVQCLVHQTVPPDRIVVLDCCPSVRTMADEGFRMMIEYAAMRGIEVSVIHSPRKLSCTEGRVRIAEHFEKNAAPNKAVLLMDDDVIVEPTYAETCFGVLERDPHVGLCVGRLISPVIAPELAPIAPSDLLALDLSERADWRMRSEDSFPHGDYSTVGFGAVMFAPTCLSSDLYEEVMTVTPAAGEDRLYASLLVSRRNKKVVVMYRQGKVREPVVMVHLNVVSKDHYPEANKYAAQLYVREVSQANLATGVEVE